MALLDWLRRTWTSSGTVSTPPSPPHGEPDETMDSDAWTVLSNVNEWVKHAETKLGVVLAFLGVLAAGLITLAIEVGRPSLVMAILEGIAGGLLLLGMGCASMGLLPQFVHESEETKMNPLYYGDVRRHFAAEPAKYAAHLRSALSGPQVMTDHVAHQIVANSKVAVRKYTWANRAILIGYLSLLTTGALVLGLVLGW